MEDAPFDNSTVGATAMVYRPETRTPEQIAIDDRRFNRKQRRQLMRWRLRGFLPRGWKDNGDDY